MREIAASLLDGLGPLNFIGAQAVYLSQPMLNTFFPEDQVNAFADLLENPEETKAFTHFLCQEPLDDIASSKIRR
jgi:hypothetical protein